MIFSVLLLPHFPKTIQLLLQPRNELHLPPDRWAGRGLQVHSSPLETLEKAAIAGTVLVPWCLFLISVYQIELIVIYHSDRHSLLVAIVSLLQIHDPLSLLSDILRKRIVAEVRS